MLENDNYVNEAGVEAIATHVNARLKKVTSMPETPSIDTIILYIGESTSTYTCGAIYKYTADGWVNISQGIDDVAREVATGAMALAQSIDDVTNIYINELRATKVDKTTTVNGHELSADVIVTKADVGLGNVVNVGSSATPVDNGTDNFTTGGAYTELAKKADNTTIGSLSSLTTTDKSDVVSAINEVDSNCDNNTNNINTLTTTVGNNTTNIGTLSSLTTTDKTDLVSAINEVVSTKQDNLTTAQTNAVNSGITSAKVTQYDAYATNKQDLMQFDDPADFPLVTGVIFQYVGTTGSGYINGRFYKYSGSSYDEIELNDHTAATTSYNNATSGLTATNVQTAIDELNTNISNIPDSIVPKGTIAFASLPALSSVNVGWMYNISDNFTTTSDFITPGVNEKAGSNVYCADTGSNVKKWDVFAVAPDITVDQIYDDTSANPQSGVAVAGALATLDVSSVGGSGKYISAIEEVDGKIAATATNLSTAPTAGDNAPITSDAVNTALANVKGVPIGTIIPRVSSSTTVPTGWLVCDGSTFSSTDYPDLYTLLGSTTLPDLSGTALLPYSEGNPLTQITVTYLIRAA